jgi:hypothetical protein
LVGHVQTVFVPIGIAAVRREAAHVAAAFDVNASVANMHRAAITKATANFIRH